MDNKITFTREQLDLLYPAEIHFQSAIQDNTIRNCSRQLVETVKMVYENATGTKAHVNMSCHVCRFQFIKKVGLIYFNDKKYWDKQPKEEKVEVYTEAVTFTIDEQSTIIEQESTIVEQETKPIKRKGKKNEK